MKIKIIIFAIGLITVLGFMPVANVFSAGVTPPGVVCNCDFTIMSNSDDEAETRILEAECVSMGADWDNSENECMMSFQLPDRVFVEQCTLERAISAKFDDEFLARNTVAGACTATGGSAGTGADTVGPEKLPNFLKTENPNELIGRMIKFLMGFVGSAALIVFIYGGVMWLISQGREEYITKGKNAMVWAAVGMVVVFASYIIVYEIIKLIGDI